MAGSPPKNARHLPPDAKEFFFSLKACSMLAVTAGSMGVAPSLIFPGLVSGFFLT